MKYYSANGILGCGALFNQVYSDRSDGKTFDIKYRGLLRFKKHGYVTVYVRRWKSEFSKSMQDTFLNEVFRVYPELDIYDVRADKSGIQLKPRGTDNSAYKYAFYFCPISISNRLKSNFDISNIREIDFDEYVPLDNRYATDEMINILELYNTCDRDRNVVKLCTFGNRITGTNPFLSFFDIRMDITKPKIQTFKNGQIAIQVYCNPERREVKSQSSFAQIVEGTIYDNYMRGGVLNGVECVLRHKTDTAVLWTRFKTCAGEGTIWRDNDKYYVSERTVHDDTHVIVDKPYGYPNETVVTLSNLATALKDIYRTSCLYACTEHAWQLFAPIMKLICMK